MSLIARIERLEAQFFPPTPQNTFMWQDFLFVFYLERKYGANVEQHIWGIKLYKYRLLAPRIHAILASKADAEPVRTKFPTLPTSAVPRKNRKTKPPKPQGPKSVLR